VPRFHGERSYDRRMRFVARLGLAAARLRWVRRTPV